MDQAHARGLPKSLARALPAFIGFGAAGYAWMLGAVPEEGAARLIAVVAAALMAALVAAAAGGQLRRVNERLTHAARTDLLTGLLNRRAFEELLDLELERSRRSGRPVSVVICDLDAFSSVNELAGHDAGDEALRLIAQELQKWKRAIDVAARTGGQEFGLLLPDTDEHGSLLVAERLRRSIQRTFADTPTPLTASYGVASFPEHGEACDELLRAADGALRMAKHRGGNRSALFSPGPAPFPQAALVAERPPMPLATVISLAEALDARDEVGAGE